MKPNYSGLCERLNDGKVFKYTRAHFAHYNNIGFDYYVQLIELDAEHISVDPIMAMDAGFPPDMTIVKTLPRAYDISRGFKILT